MLRVLTRRRIYLGDTMKITTFNIMLAGYVVIITILLIQSYVTQTEQAIDRAAYFTVFAGVFLLGYRSQMKKPEETP
jgi:hypothetical protein